MSNLTKAQLQAKVDLLETDLRRVNRALGQASIDLSIDEVSDFAEVTPHMSEHAFEAIKRAQAEWALNVREPEERIDTYIRSSAGLHWSWEEPYVKMGSLHGVGRLLVFVIPKYAH